MKLKMSTLALTLSLILGIPVSAFPGEVNSEVPNLVTLDSTESVKPYDRTFIDEMSEHHKEGVMMAEIAVRKAHHPELKKMAQMMMKDQMDEIKLMQEWRRDWYPHAADFRSHSVGMRMEKLESLSGEEFDIAFLDSMIMHHPGAIYLGQEAQSRGFHRKLINLAKKISSAQIKELNQLRMWRYVWSNHDSEQ